MLLMTSAYEHQANQTNGESKARECRALQSLRQFQRAQIVLTAGVLLSFRPISLEAADVAASSTWYKGVVHAHANWGAPQLPTTSPDVVVRWYREHNYNFVSVTDLNYYTPPDGLKALFDAPGRFLVVPGTEPSKDPIQPGNKIVDTIGIGVSAPVNLPTGH